MIHVNRVAKVVKGGRRFSFNAIVAMGRPKRPRRRGPGGEQLPTRSRKAGESAKKGMFAIPLIKGTIPHVVVGHFGAGRVLLKPASSGTGVIAGGAVRAILEAAGVHDVLTKSLGTTNAHNITKATVDGLRQLRKASDVAQARGMTVAELLGSSPRRSDVAQA